MRMRSRYVLYEMHVYSYKCLLSCVNVIILRVWYTGTGGEEYGSTVSDLPSDSTRLFRSD